MQGNKLNDGKGNWRATITRRLLVLLQNARDPSEREVEQVFFSDKHFIQGLHYSIHKFFTVLLHVSRKERQF